MGNQMIEESMEELVDEFIDHKKLHRLEGDRGVENLETLAEALGYDSHPFRYGSSVEVFLSDNPGAIEAVIEWIKNQNNEDWKENLESHLPAKDEDEESEE